MRSTVSRHPPYPHTHKGHNKNPMSINYLLNPLGTSNKSPRLSSSSSSASSPPLTPEEKLRLKRKIQSEKKRLWRASLTPEQKERRQLMDAQRKRIQRRNQTETQRAETRRRDAARKAAKRGKTKKRKLQQDFMHEQQKGQHHRIGRSSTGGEDYRNSLSATQRLHLSIDAILNAAGSK